MQLRSLTISIALLSSIFLGCAVHTPKIPKGIFLQKEIYTPFEAKSDDDILRCYVELWGAYKKNLSLIDAIEQLNSK